MKFITTVERLPIFFSFEFRTLWIFKYIYFKINILYKQKISVKVSKLASDLVSSLWKIKWMGEKQETWFVKERVNFVQGNPNCPQRFINQVIFDKWNLTVFEHSLYSSDLELCNFVLFPKIKSVVKETHFVTVKDVNMRTMSLPPILMKNDMHLYLFCKYTELNYRYFGLRHNIHVTLINFYSIFINEKQSNIYIIYKKRC